MCKQGYSCVNGVGHNPDSGYTNFDTISWAFLTILRLLTLDNWTSVYHYLHYSSGYLAYPFLLMAPLLSIPFINLAAVIMVYSVISYDKKIRDKPEG